MLSAREEYSRYYGDFRGVDFSSDHTQVLDQRLAYSVNVYKDYQSGTVGGLETIAGFRRIFEASGEEVYAIHKYETDEKHILVHMGDKLYWWDSYPLTANIVQRKTLEVPAPTGEDTGYKMYIWSFLGIDTSLFLGAGTIDGTTLNSEIDKYGRLLIYSNEISEGDIIAIEYYETTDPPVLCNLEKRKSESFMFNNKLYIIDGKNYLCYDGEKITDVRDNAYIPTTYKNIIPEGENANTGLEYEERNVIQPKFRNTFYGNGSCTKFVLSERYIDDLPKVVVYGKELTVGTDFTIERDENRNILGVITIIEAPKKPTDMGYPETYAGVEITAEKAYINSSDAITKCTISAIFDERVFLSGNPDSPNMIYFCGRSNVTGFTDPTYFPATNFQRDGVGAAGITGLVPVADTLMALKSDSQQDGSIYFHSEQATGEDLHPKNYPSARGLAGMGCVGACINFLDDPIFVSRLGVEGIGQLSVRLERAIEHRSSLIDGKLLNIGEEALKNAVLEEWNGYLLLLVDGKIFMADSRQRYTHDTGVMQYEWYYLEDIGVYENWWYEYVYDTYIPEGLEGKKLRGYEIAISENSGEAVNAETNVDEEGKALIQSVDFEDYKVNYVVKNNKAYLCHATGAKTGGDFYKAVMLKVIDGNIYFGTSNGVICSFNFDMRDKNGELPTEAYSFDGRTIFSGVATKMDSCSIPHLTKNTVKKSTVIKTKSTASSTLKVKVRTNRKPYAQLARINTSRFAFDDVDFADFSFNIENDTIFAIKEKEKHWVEKQYYLYSDEYCKPLSVFYIAYRYNVAGRIK